MQGTAAAQPSLLTAAYMGVVAMVVEPAVGYW